MDQGRRWAQAAGATVISQGKETGVEVSPLISYVSHSVSLIPVFINTFDRPEKDSITLVARQSLPLRC